MRKVAVFLVIGTMFGVLGVPPASAAATIRVSPSSSLVDGQSVAVQGGGFSGADKVVLKECTRTAAGLACDYRKASSSDTSGRLNGTVMKVYNAVQGNACSAAHPCFVRAKDTHGNVAKATVSFGKY
jgi:hypothetical protein